MANIVTERLRDEIVDGIFQSGEHITISNLSEKYGVSHMPVREAFQCLKGEGLLELEQYKGARVLSISNKDIGHIYDIRMVMEQLIMSEVVQSEYAPDFLERLKRINNKIDLSLPDAQLSSQYQDINNEFHYLLFTHCENKRAVNQYTFYSNLFRSLKKRYPNTPKEIRTAQADHWEILHALEQRDDNGLQNLIHRHATTAKANLLGKMAGDSAG